MTTVTSVLQPFSIVLYHSPLFSINIHHYSPLFSFIPSQPQTAAAAHYAQINNIHSIIPSAQTASGA
jgi:hypothetical protein